MHLNLEKIIPAIFSYVSSWFMMVNLLHQSESNIYIHTVLMVCFSIKKVEWTEDKSFSILGFNIYSEKKIISQFKIFGLIPIGQPEPISLNTEIGGDLPKFLWRLKRVIKAFLPFEAFLPGSDDDD